jgi:hypothetical protein
MNLHAIGTEQQIPCLACFHVKCSYIDALEANIKHLCLFWGTATSQISEGPYPTDKCALDIAFLWSPWGKMMTCVTINEYDHASKFEVLPTWHIYISCTPVKQLMGPGRAGALLKQDCEIEHL